LTTKTPYKGPGADSEEKHEPARDIDTVVVDSLKVLDPKWPIREADIGQNANIRKVPKNEPALAGGAGGAVGRIVSTAVTI
jgi:hypothetical protein